jgi:hypothetical protein
VAPFLTSYIGNGEKTPNLFSVTPIENHISSGYCAILGSFQELCYPFEGSIENSLILDTTAQQSHHLIIAIASVVESIPVHMAMPSTGWIFYGMSSFAVEADMRIIFFANQSS